MAAGGHAGGSRRSVAEGAAFGIALVAPRGAREAVAAAPLRIRAALAREIEQRRLFPWLAVAFGLGVVLFFQAEGEPALWAPIAGFAAAASAAVLLRRNHKGFVIAVGSAAVFAGFAAGVVRTRAVGAPVLTRVAITTLSGFVESIEERGHGARLLVRVHDLAGIEKTRRPALVRVTIRDRQTLQPGDFIAANARLLPPPEPARPGGYDFARDAYFRGIGAVGSLLGRVEAVPPPVPADRGLAWAAGVDAARNTLTRRIADAIGGQAGAVAAALVTGKRGAIEEGTNDILRAAGIYHVVSISGLHMVLAAGVFFWLTRALLALAPAAALFWPLKKIAAAVAMLGAAAYCVFSGSEVATERSLIMTLVMLGAILVDRPVLSTRNLALSALIVLAREPEALLGPSFQMSYGAVAALITLAGAMTRHPGATRPDGLLARGVHGAKAAAVGVLATTLVASLATAPFSAYHFQSANPFGLLGNALTLPLVSIVVMPSAVLGVLAYPFGLDRPVWEVMGLAVTQVLALSEWVSGLSGSTLVVSAQSPAALGLFALALLVATLCVSWLRWLAAIPALAALAVSAFPERFDVYVDRAGAGAAVRGRQGYLVSLGRPSAFVLEQWLRADGDPRETDDTTLRIGPRCDRLGCVIEAEGERTVALVLDRAAFAEDCTRATVVISHLRAPPDCGAPVVIDRRRLDAQGATAVRFGAGPAQVVSTRRADEVRPWHKRASPAREGARAVAAESRPAGRSGPQELNLRLPDGRDPDRRTPRPASRDEPEAEDLAQ